MNLLLRPITEADLPILFAQQEDPAGHALVGTKPRTWEEFTAHMAKISTDPTTRLYVIEADGQVAGSIGSFERGGLREVGCRIGADYWSRGIATQALTAFLPLDPVRPLHAGVSKINRASWRVLEKCGFRIEHEETFTAADGRQVEGLLMRLAD